MDLTIFRIRRRRGKCEVGVILSFKSEGWRFVLA
jgi:hypothetical protein